MIGSCFNQAFFCWLRFFIFSILSLASEQKRNVTSALIHLNLSNKGKPFSAGFFSL